MSMEEEYWKRIEREFWRIYWPYVTMQVVAAVAFAALSVFCFLQSLHHMNIIDQDALEREYRNLVFEDFAQGFGPPSDEKNRAMEARWRRMEELRNLINDPVQRTIDTECEVVEPKGPEPHDPMPDVLDNR